MNINAISQWASAHVFYNLFFQDSVNMPKSVLEEIRWRKRNFNKSPNGKLLIENSFFNMLRNSKKVYLLHTTFNLEEIVKSNCIYSSGGCLVGSIYCTPLVNNNGKFRLHNLGKYIYEEEAPMVGGEKMNKNPQAIVIEVETSEESRNNLIGIDYLRLGRVHLDIYQDLGYLLSYRERFELYQVITQRVKRSLDYLNYCSNLWFLDQKPDPKVFFDLFFKAIDNLPILGYLYFEALSEYLLLYQDNRMAQIYKEVGEFYNPTYKALMYTLLPEFVANFRLSAFKPAIINVVDYIKSNSIFTVFNQDEMVDYLAERLYFFTNTRLLDLKKNMDWSNFKWDFENLIECAGPLIGHLIHRELRVFGRYPSFYFYFDQYKALQIWNYWNHMDVLIPFNGVIPKGEIGINPAYPDLKYRIFEGHIQSGKDFNYLELGKQLQIEIVPKLTDLKFTILRNKSEAVVQQND